MKRLQRVNALIKKEVSRTVERYTLDHNMEFITITRAEVSSNLKDAKIFFTVHNPECIASAQDDLNNGRKFIQKLVAKRIRLKYTPRLNFVYDDGLEKYEKIEGLLASIEKEKDREV